MQGKYVRQPTDSAVAATTTSRRLVGLGSASAATAEGNEHLNAQRSTFNFQRATPQAKACGYSGGLGTAERSTFNAQLAGSVAPAARTRRVCHESTTCGVSASLRVRQTRLA